MVTDAGGTGAIDLLGDVRQRRTTLTGRRRVPTGTCTVIAGTGAWPEEVGSFSGDTMMIVMLDYHAAVDRNSDHLESQSIKLQHLGYVLTARKACASVESRTARNEAPWPPLHSPLHVPSDGLFTGTPGSAPRQPAAASGAPRGLSKGRPRSQGRACISGLQWRRVYSSSLFWVEGHVVCRGESVNDRENAGDLRAGYQALCNGDNCRRSGETEYVPYIRGRISTDKSIAVSTRLPRRSCLV